MGRHLAARRYGEMMSGPVTIDLGTIPHERPEPESSPAWNRWGRRGYRGFLIDHPALRWMLIAAVSVLLAATMTSAAAPAPPWATLLFTDQVHHLAMHGDTLYTVGQEEDGAVTAAAYGPDGTRRWEVPLAEGPLDGAVIDAVEDVVVVALYGSRDLQTAILNSADGSPLWNPGDASWIWLFGNGLIYGTEAGPEPDLVVADLRTGQEQWRVPAADFASIQAAGRYLLILAPDGRITSYDAGGQQVGSLSSGADAARAGMSMTDSLVLLETRGSPPAITAYGIPGLDERWSVELPPDAWTAGCGRWVCLHDRGGRPSLLDPDTGELRWSADWLPAEGPPPWVQAPEDPHLAGHLAFVQFSRRGAQTHWLVSAEDGRPAADLHDWLLQQQPELHVTAGPSGQLLTRRDGDLTWVGRLRPDLSGVDLLGTAPTADGTCLVGTGLMACRPSSPVGSVPVEVWRIRR